MTRISSPIAADKPRERHSERARDRQAELLGAIVDFLLAHGVSDLSLRPLAEGVGTSARLLIYHFGSKENLLVLALDEVRARVMAALAALGQTAGQARPTPDMAMALTRFWHWATHPDNQGYFRLLFELDGLAMFDRVTLPDSARQQGTMLWIDRVEALVRHFHPQVTDVRAQATLIAAALSGLLQDRLSTGERERTDAAFASLLAWTVAMNGVTRPS